MLAYWLRISSCGSSAGLVTTYGLPLATKSGTTLEMSLTSRSAWLKQSYSVGRGPSTTQVRGDPGPVGACPHLVGLDLLRRQGDVLGVTGGVHRHRRGPGVLADVGLDQRDDLAVGRLGRRVTPCR